MFLFVAIGIGLLSLSASTIIMTNAQAPSNTTSGSSNSTNNETRATQMGICVVGVTSPCNHDINSSDMPSVLFNQMLSECRENEDYVRAASSKDEYFVAESLFMALILQQQKMINELIAKVSAESKY